MDYEVKTIVLETLEESEVFSDKVVEREFRVAEKYFT